MKNLNTFVRYHGCNIGCRDGTRQLVKKTCSRPTFNPFWKNPEHSTNRVAKSTTALLKQNPLAYRNDIRRYVKKFTLDTLIAVKPD